MALLDLKAYTHVKNNSNAHIAVEKPNTISFHGRGSVAINASWSWTCFGRLSTKSITAVILSDTEKRSEVVEILPQASFGSTSLVLPSDVSGTETNRHVSTWETNTHQFGSDVTDTQL